MRGKGTDLWPFSGHQKSPPDFQKRLDKILDKFGRSSATYIEFAANRAIQGIKPSRVSQSDLELMVSAIERDRQNFERLRKIEFTIFSCILLIFLNVAQQVSLLGISLPASQNVMAILIFAFSTLQIVGLNSRIDLAVKKRILLHLLSSTSDLDPSGVQRLLLTDSASAIDAWNEAMKSRGFLPGWQFFALTAYMIPLVIHLSLVVLAVHAVVILASFTLAEANGWEWIYLAIFIGSVLGIATELILYPLLLKVKINYRELYRRKKFAADMEKYGLEGALRILGDELERMQYDLEVKHDGLTHRIAKESREEHSRSQQ